MANEQFPIGCSIFRWNLRFVGGQPGNCNHSRAKALQKGLQGHLQGPKKTFAGSTSKLNAQGAKCQSCVCLEPCLFDGDDDIVGTVSILQNFAAVIVKFAHLLFFFKKVFWDRFDSHSLWCCRGDRPQGWVRDGLVIAALVGQLYTPDRSSYLDKLYSLVSQHPNFEQSTIPTSVSDKFWFSVNIMRDLKELREVIDG